MTCGSTELTQFTEIYEKAQFTEISAGQKLFLATQWVHTLLVVFNAWRGRSLVYLVHFRDFLRLLRWFIQQDWAIRIRKLWNKCGLQAILLPQPCWWQVERKSAEKDWVFSLPDHLLATTVILSCLWTWIETGTFFLGSPVSQEFGLKQKVYLWSSGSSTCSV